MVGGYDVMVAGADADGMCTFEIIWNNLKCAASRWMSFKELFFKNHFSWSLHLVYLFLRTYVDPWT